jgi:hypothetical protein
MNTFKVCQRIANIFFIFPHPLSAVFNTAYAKTGESYTCLPGRRLAGAGAGDFRAKKSKHIRMLTAPVPFQQSRIGYLADSKFYDLLRRNEAGGTSIVWVRHQSLRLAAAVPFRKAFSPEGQPSDGGGFLIFFAARRFFLAAAADAVERQPVVDDLEMPVLFHDLFHFPEQILLNFFHGAAFDANEMVMEMFGAFLPQIVPGNPVSEINFIDDFQFGQQLQRAINGSKADFRGFFFNVEVHVLRAQMLGFVFQQNPDDCFPLRGQLVTGCM